MRNLGSIKERGGVTGGEDDHFGGGETGVIIVWEEALGEERVGSRLLLPPRAQGRKKKPFSLSTPAGGRRHSPKEGRKQKEAS